MKNGKLIAGIIGLILGIVIAFFLPIPHGLTHAAMVVLATLVTANIFWIFNVIPSFATGLLMLSTWVVLQAVPFETSFAIFSTTTMWIIIGGLALGAAATKTGLITRIAYKIMSYFPANFKGQSLALFISGTIIAPMIPSAHPKAAMSTPIAKGISDALGYKPKSAASSGLFLAAMWGFFVTEGSFLSATAQNYAFKGLLPAKYQSVLSWGNWFVMMIPWTIIILVAGYFLLSFLFKPKDDTPVSREFINEQLKALGPMSKNEKITAISIIAAIIMWILESTINIPSAVTALVWVSILVAAKVLTAEDFKTRMSWSTIIFIGTVMALGNVMQTVGLTNWLRDVLKPVIGPIIGNIWVAVIVLPIIIYLIKFVVVSLISTGTLVTLALLPFVTQMGFSPALIVIIVTTSVNVWLLSYMNAPFLTGSAAVQDGMASRASLAKSSIGYMAINIIGLLVCVPVWHLMGIA
ncbi:2-oxoglutarate translocator [Secundilactobacillus pentosiphilus]|uniref:2-oxoglutarate translocator n=1 Tax=Secundilactobacillus pentosiphilus TaxID=1714682 RepID=A0A1Z5IX89_9LACO|nr:SLC13 family permease [Secundilactobacillus pentosiphilus]GAX06420.1 2-oxoglutarate translocator [Secundilactobacillus pentosiphilus]